MKPTLLPLALAVMLAAGMCGCEEQIVRPIDRIQNLGNANIDGCEYMVVHVYAGNCIPVHKGNCTNHAPVVVTNTVTVTNECHLPHWSYIVEIDPGITLPAHVPLRWSTNGYWYVPVTNAVEK